jgi:hypothetical protein
MELHARVTNAAAANRSTAMLPPTFKYYEAIPAPPANCSWRFDIAKQLWTAVWTANGRLNFELKDGIKYMLGIGEHSFSYHACSIAMNNAVKASTPALLFCTEVVSCCACFMGLWVYA